MVDARQNPAASRKALRAVDFSLFFSQLASVAALCEVVVIYAAALLDPVDVPVWVPHFELVFLTIVFISMALAMASTASRLRKLCPDE